MKLKFDLADRDQSALIFRAIGGAWPDLLNTSAIPAAAVADKPAPVADTVPVVADSPAQVDITPAPVAETAAPVVETAAPVADAAPATKAASADLDTLIAGRALTKSLKVADGGTVRPGEEVYLRDGTMMLVEATMRGTAICVDEDKVLTAHDAASLYSSMDAIVALEKTTPAANTTAAPVAPVADAPPATPAAPAPVVNGAASDLPADYLLAELNTAGNAVKKAHSVAKVLELLAQVSPGTMRLSELPLPKRQPLLDAFKQALAA